ncbi:MAG: DUF3037 domain-containing protein [Bryobacteraceae bacterium]|nr:DUF3037 domain-containing protein [Bryobacteraceae bacterium]
MHERSSFDYAVLRVVPRVERGEFLNAGLIMLCLTRNFLSARVHFEEPLLLSICPDLDTDTVKRHLEAFPRICSGEPDAGPIALLPNRQKFHWLVAPRSTIVQVSPVHCGLCESPAEMFESLFARLVTRVVPPAVPRNTTI